MKPSHSFGSNSRPLRLDIHLAPIFKGSPGVEVTSFSLNDSKPWRSKRLQKVDSVKLLLAVVQNSTGESRRLTADDLDKISLRHAQKREGARGLNRNASRPAIARFVEIRPADLDSLPRANQEVTSGENVTSDMEQLVTARADAEEFKQMGGLRIR